MIIEPYADHLGHRKNLSGQHKGNLFCVECSVRVAEPTVANVEHGSEEAAAASVPVAAVVTGEGVTAVAAMATLQAFRTWGKTGMLLARNFRPTVRAWNELTGQSCRTRAQVGDAAHELIKAIRTERDGK
jgi:hypothetical protein